MPRHLEPPRHLPGSRAPAAGVPVVGWYAHHAGSGHVTRALAVAARARADVVVLSSARRPPGWPVERWVALPDDAAPVGADPTAGGALHWAPTAHPGFTARMRRVADWVARARPAALVVDVSVEVALLGRLLGVPVVVTVMAGDRSDRAHRLGYDAATALVAAWPAAVGPAPVHGWRPEWTPRTSFTGALSRLDDVLAAPALAAPPDLPTGSARVALRLGGAGAGGWWAAEPPPVPGWRWTRPAGDDPRSVAAALAAADVVVLHAGQNALAEVAAARRPAVVVPDDRPHGEQHALAAAVAALGAAEVLTDPGDPGDPGFPGTGGWAAVLERARRRGGERWAAWSDRHGAQRYADVVDAVAGCGAPALDDRPERAS